MPAQQLLNNASQLLNDRVVNARQLLVNCSITAQQVNGYFCYNAIEALSFARPEYHELS